MSAILKPRDYQLATLAALEKDWDSGLKRLAAVLPTGAGKTVVFAHLASQFVALNPTRRVLVLAHTDELVSQAASKLRQVAPHLKVGIVKAVQNEVTAQVVVASVQSLRSQKRREMIRNVGLVIVDECHHATAKTYRDILAHFRCMDGMTRTAGFTATLTRGDGGKLSDIWEKVSYRKDLSFMIRAGYLIPPLGKRIEIDDLDLSKVKKSAGDYQAGDLEDALDAALAPEIVAKAYVEHAADRPGILFAPTVESAYTFAAELVAQGISTEVVHGALAKEERRAILKRLESGETQVISNCMVLCLDERTEILTDTGWVGMDDMTMTHRVANWDQGKVFFTEPTDIARRELGTDEKMYSLTTRGREVRVTGGHRMIYRTSKNSLWKKTPVENLVDRAVWIPTCGHAEPRAFPVPECRPPSRVAVSHTAYSLRKREGYEWEESKVEATRRVERQNSLRHLAPHELTADQCRFIGFWIGDGSKNDLIRGGVKYTASQSITYPNIIDWFDKVITSCGIHAVRRDRSKTKVPHIRWSFPRGTGSGSQQRDGVFPIEEYLKKGGSELLWGLDREQFDALLEGLWYADGNHGKAQDGYPAGWQISATRKPLLDLLQAIGSVRGMEMSLRPAGMPSSDRHAQLYVLTRSTSVDHMTRTHRFTEDREWRAEKVWCVKTTTRNIVTRLNGTVTVMGNTEGFDSPKISCIVIARPTRSAGLYQQMVGRGLRPDLTRSREGQNCLILDVVGASAVHGLASLVDLSEKEIRLQDGQSLIEAEDALDLLIEEEAGSPRVRLTHFGPTVAVDFDPLATASTRVWLKTGGGTYFLSAGTGAGAVYVFVIPSTDPDSEPGTYDVLWCTKSTHDDRRGGLTEHLGLPLDLAFAWGEDDAVERGGLGADVTLNKKSAWRRTEPSQAQLDLCRSRGIVVLGGESKGEVSALIDAHMASKRIDPIATWFANKGVKV